MKKLAKSLCFFWAEIERKKERNEQQKTKKNHPEYENNAVLLVDRNIIFVSFYFCRSFKLSIVARHTLPRSNPTRFPFMVLKIFRNLCEV